MIPPPCPTCGEPLAGDGRFCRSCGATIPTQTEISCSACGHPNPADSGFCRLCGQALATAEPVGYAAEPTLVGHAPQWPPPPPGRRTATSVVVAIVLGVLLVLGAGTVAAVLLTRSHANRPAVTFAATAPTTTTVTETTASQPSPTEAPVPDTSATTPSEPTAVANPYSEVPQIETVFREFYEDLLSSNFQGAWEHTSFRYRKEKEGEPGGYGTWVTNEKTLQGHLDPSGLRVSVYSWEPRSQVATVQLTGMHWTQTGSPCTYWQGITWMRHEGPNWYYEPGYSISPQRRAQWIRRRSELLGWGCA